MTARFRWLAALAAALATAPNPAACAHAQAALAFPEVPAESPRPPSHRWAYASLGTGVALIGSSFLFKERADDAYDDYLLATDPDRIETLYDRTVLHDRLSRASLLTGEVLVGVGLYLRFIRPAPATGFALAVEPSRCGLTFRF